VRNKVKELHQNLLPTDKKAPGITESTLTSSFGEVVWTGGPQMYSKAKNL